MFLLSSLSDMIINSASLWVGGSVGKWLVVAWLAGRWSVDLLKLREKMVAVVTPPVHFDRGLFCCCSFNFCYIDDKEETNLIDRSSHSSL